MQYRSILGYALYADILKPAVLSLCLQDDELDVVSVIKSILKSSGSLKHGNDRTKTVTNSKIGTRLNKIRRE